MGGHGSGRKSSGKEFLPIRANIAQPASGAPFELPNLSGDHSAGTTGTPSKDLDIANKKYVDDNAGGGDVTAAINLTDIKIVQGDGGAKGVKTSNATVTQVVTSAIHSASDGSDHSIVGTNTSNITTNTTAIGLNTTHAGSDGSDHSDVVANTSASHAQSHTILSHSDTTATGAELDTLTGGGDTTLHDHDGISENTTHRGLTNIHISGEKFAASGSATTTLGAHVADSTDPHGAHLTQAGITSSGTISGSTVLVTTDHTTSGSALVVGIITDTNATPPTASGFAQGTLYIQYTA